MNTQKLSLIVTLLAWTVSVLIAPPARAESPVAALSPAGQFIQKLGDQALMELTDAKLPRATREARARTLLNTYFDVPTIGRFALGTYWRVATDAEKAEYVGLFEDMIVKTYTTRFEGYSGQSFKVDGAREDGEKDSIVSSRIVQKGGPPVMVEWRVRKKNGGMKVVDVVVESISMSVTQRSDFSSVIQSKGGKVSALLDSLRARKTVAATK
jgi:phospholipid transport system substrate-binding protein